MPTDSRDELMGSPTEEREHWGLSATRVFRCDWADRYFIRGLILNFPGEIYPYAPEFFAYARVCSIAPTPGEPPSADGGLNSYTQAMITVRYETAKAGVADRSPNDPTVAVSEEWLPKYDWVTVPYRDMQWKTGIQRLVDPNDISKGLYEDKLIKPEQAPGVLFTEGFYRVTFHNLAALPPNFDGYIGSCNSDTITAYNINRSFQPETLAFLSGPTTRTYDIGGFPRYSQELNFYWKANGHNKYYRPDLYAGDSADIWDTLQILDPTTKTYKDYIHHPPVPFAPLFS